MQKIRVLIVDDSALVRQVLTDLLSADPGIEVVGSAADPYLARDKIKTLSPDVLTLDVEMPRMDGLTFLSNLMRLRPMPVVMVSSLTERGAEVTLKALELGAVDFVTKPRLGLTEGLQEYAEDLVAKVHQAAVARVSARADGPAQAGPVIRMNSLRTTDQVIAIGASTGGTEAIRAVLQVLPPDCPPVVIAQHIPAAFSASFAERLDQHSALVVCQSRGNERLMAGHAYVAPGDRHLQVMRSGAHFLTRLDDGPPVNRHKPSVDVLFDSVAIACGRNAVAAILTGMGEDGARGLLAMREAGATTLAQDEATSVVWGMPGSAVRLGAADRVLPLAEVPAALVGGGRVEPPATGAKTNSLSVR